MNGYRDEVPVPVNRPPKDMVLNPVHINVAKVWELQDSLNACLARIIEGLSGNPFPNGDGMKPTGLIEKTELLVEQAKANCEMANTIYDMLLGER